MTMLNSSSVSASLKVLQVSKSLAKPTRPVMSRAMRIVILFMSSCVPAGSCDMFLMTLASVRMTSGKPFLPCKAPQTLLIV